ncbi:unnamed protein product [Mucor hiemalis]
MTLYINSKCHLPDASKSAFNVRAQKIHIHCTTKQHLFFAALFDIPNPKYISSMYFEKKLYLLVGKWHMIDRYLSLYIIRAFIILTSKV